MNKIALTIDVVVVLMFGLALLLVGDFSGAAQWFPVTVLVPGLVLAVANLVVDSYQLVRHRRLRVTAELGAPESRPDDVGERALEFKKSARWLLWIVGYAVLVFIVGVFIGTAVWLVCFFVFATKVGLRFALTSTAVTLGAMVLYGNFMGLTWPESMLELPF